jgi:predicted ATPase
MSFLKSIQLSGFLSFPPDSLPLELSPLNVLIGPNASGKSNLIEAIELLHATPTSLASAIRAGGGVQEWLWKGASPCDDAQIELIVDDFNVWSDLRYRLRFAANGPRLEVIEEVIEETDLRKGEKLRFSYYRLSDDLAAIMASKPIQLDEASPEEVFLPLPPAMELPPTPKREVFSQYVKYYLDHGKLESSESILSQRKDPEVYPELTRLGQQFSQIQLFREWSIGRRVDLRQPQPADLPSDRLLPDSRNLGLILNDIEYSGASAEFNRILRQFLPRYERFSTRIHGGTVQLYLHEEGLSTPIPATRLSDGTLRFMAMVAILLMPSPPPLICMEEPELGLHPDAVGLLADLMIEASKRTQLIVTTHSDALVSALTDHAQSVMVCEYRNGTRIERLDPDQLSFWLDQYRLGEVWRMGELGGNP